MRLDPNSAEGIARDVCVRATLCRLREDAATLTALCIEPPLPVLPDDPVARERVLLGLLVEARAAVRFLIWQLDPL